MLVINVGAHHTRDGLTAAFSLADVVLVDSSSQLDRVRLQAGFALFICPLRNIYPSCRFVTCDTPSIYNMLTLIWSSLIVARSGQAFRLHQHAASAWPAYHRIL